MTRFGIGNFLGLIQAGKVKALAVSADKRSPLLPDVPTFAEAGLGGYPGQGWWGLAGAEGHAARDRRQGQRRFRQAVQRAEICPRSSTSRRWCRRRRRRPDSPRS